MRIKQEIGVGLNSKDRERMRIFLVKFLKHVDRNKLVVCGGLAIRFNITQHGLTFPRRPFNDLDLLIESPNDIKPTITTDFMLYHYHPKNPSDPVEPSYFFYAFVDSQSRLKADVFPYRWSAPGRFVWATFQGKPIKVVGIEDQLIQCLYDVSRISPQLKVDPKQLDGVHTLMKIANVTLAEKIWKTNNHPSYVPILKEAIEKADALKVSHPQWWQEKPYRKPKPYKCSYCQSRSNYRIVEMIKIYKVLGYVE